MQKKTAKTTAAVTTHSEFYYWDTQFLTTSQHLPPNHVFQLDCTYFKIAAFSHVHRHITYHTVVFKEGRRHKQLLATHIICNFILPGRPCSLTRVKVILKC